MCIMLLCGFGLQQVQQMMAAGKHSQEQSPQTWCQLIATPGWCMLRPCGSYHSQTSHPQTGSSTQPVQCPHLSTQHVVLRLVQDDKPMLDLQGLLGFRRGTESAAASVSQTYLAPAHVPVTCVYPYTCAAGRSCLNLSPGHQSQCHWAARQSCGHSTGSSDLLRWGYTWLTWATAGTEM